MHESVEPLVYCQTFAMFLIEQGKFFYLYPLPNLIPKHFVFRQNLPKAILMPINKRYPSHYNYRLRVRPNLDSLPHERILNSFTGLIEY